MGETGRPPAPAAERPVSVRRVELTADGRRWLVTDDHCLQPRCRCTEVVPGFAPFPERRPRPGERW